MNTTLKTTFIVRDMLRHLDDAKVPLGGERIVKLNLEVPTEVLCGSLDHFTQTVTLREVYYWFDLPDATEEEYQSGAFKETFGRFAISGTERYSDNGNIKFITLYIKYLGAKNGNHA